MKSPRSLWSTAKPLARSLRISSRRGPVVWVDTRWKGQYGIARYSTAIVSRLPQGYPARFRGDGHALTSVIQPGGLSLRSTDVFYSPGFMPILTRARQVLTLHDLIHLSTGSAPHRMFYSLFVRPVIRRAGIVITVSTTSAAAIRQWLKDPSVEVQVAPNGVEEPRTGQPPDAELPAQFYLCVSNLKRHKNVLPLLKAVQATGVNLILVVPRSEAVEAKRLAGHDEGSTTVVLSGVSDAELSWLYRHATATVQPSLEEGFGLPAAESIAHGTPVLYASDCRAVAEVVQQDGIAIFNARSPEAWIPALEAFVQGNGLHRVDAERFTRQWDESADVVRNALGRALSR